MLKVLVVAQTPPPYGGMPIMIKRLLDSDLAGLKWVHVRMAFSADADEIGRLHFAKIAHLLTVVVQVIYRRFADGPRILYYVPAGPDRMPMIRDVFILGLTRWLFSKTIFHYHLAGISELYDRLPAWQRWLFRRAYFGADAAIRVSEFNPEDGRRLAAKSNYVVYNGIDDPCPDFVAAPRCTPANPDGPLRILFAAILYESKGLLVLIEACAKLAARGVPFQLEVMGQWQREDYAARVHRRIQELNLGARVHFLGRVIGPDKFDAFRRSDVFCLPTYFTSESFGLVLIEAMACGLPVVSTRWRGIPAVVRDGETGFLVEPHDPDALANRLEELANDAELRERMGTAGRRKFEAEFVIGRHLEEMRNVLLEVGGVERRIKREVPNTLATTEI